MTDIQHHSFAVTNSWTEHLPKDDGIMSRIASLGFVQTSSIKSADLVLTSVYGRSYQPARGRLLVYSGEAYFQDELADFTIDCRFRAREDHLRLPVWAAGSLSHELDLLSVDSDFAPRFCNFIFSNYGSPTRNAFFEMLNARQPVDSLGRVMNNKNDSRLSQRHNGDWHSSKIAVLRDYRFTIAFENSELPGYTTEKMIDAWRAGSVPIYWGDPLFAVDFPPDSCLSLYEAGSFSKLLAQVLEAENEPERFAQLQAANPFRTGLIHEVLGSYRSRVADFLGKVVDEVRHPTRSAISTRRRRRVIAKVRSPLRRMLGIT